MDAHFIPSPVQHLHTSDLDALVLMTFVVVEAFLHLLLAGLEFHLHLVCVLQFATDQLIKNNKTSCIEFDVV
jgi:hypothetical protein